MQIKDLTTPFSYVTTDVMPWCSTGGVDSKVSYGDLRTAISNYAATQNPVYNNARIFDCSYRLNGDYAAGDMIAGVALTGTDGSVLLSQQIVLRYNDTNKQNNGLWQIQPSGAAVRYSKANTGGLLMYSVAMPNAGTYKGKWYKCTNYAPNIGTDAIEYAEIFTPTQSLNTTDNPTFNAISLPGGDIQDQLNTKQGIAYASIYVSDGTAAQNIPTGATYTKITAYATNGLSANCTADVANDKITITQAGVYKVNYTASYAADTNNVTFRGAVFLGGVEQDNIHSGGQMGLAGAMRSTSCGGFINVASVPADIDVRIRHDNGGTVAITHVYANLNVELVSAIIPIPSYTPTALPLMTTTQTPGVPIISMNGFSSNFEEVPSEIHVNITAENLPTGDNIVFDLYQNGVLFAEDIIINGNNTSILTNGVIAYIQASCKGYFVTDFIDAIFEIRLKSGILNGVSMNATQITQSTTINNNLSHCDWGSSKYKVSVFQSVENIVVKFKHTRISAYYDQFKYKIRKDGIYENTEHLFTSLNQINVHSYPLNTFTQGQAVKFGFRITSARRISDGVWVDNPYWNTEYEYSYAEYPHIYDFCYVVGGTHALTAPTFNYNPSLKIMEMVANYNKIWYSTGLTEQSTITPYSGYYGGSVYEKINFGRNGFTCCKAISEDLNGNMSNVAVYNIV